MVSEASKQIIELVKQWSEQASLSTEKFDLQALRAAMSATQIPVPEDTKFEKVNIEGISAEWVLDPDAKVDHRLGFTQKLIHIFRWTNGVVPVWSLGVML